MTTILEDEQLMIDFLFENSMLFWCDLLPNECIKRLQELMKDNFNYKKTDIKKHKAFRDWLKFGIPDFDNQAHNAIDKMPIPIVKKMIKSLYKDNFEPNLDCCKQYWNKDKIKI